MLSFTIAFALGVLGCLLTYEIVSKFYENKLANLSFDLRMKHLHSLYRIEAFNKDTASTRTEMREKLSEEIYKV